MYGIIHNASIEIPFDMPDNLTDKLQVQHCDQCLCKAFNNPDVVLLTCTESESNKFTCQFYYFMPTKDDIRYPKYDTNIYLIQNKTFKEKDDCCNTTYLIEKINAALDTKKAVFNQPLRFLVRGDNNTIVSTSINKLIKFNTLTLTIINELDIPESKTVGYCDGYYYLGKDKTIHVYDKTLTSNITSFSVGNVLTPIRCLPNNTQMLIGTTSEAYICEKQQEVFNSCINITAISAVQQQIHAFGIVNDSAFYTGWDAKNQNIRLYTKDQNNLWIESDGINQTDKISDIVIDDCKRIWAVLAETRTIIIYDQNKTHYHNITFNQTVFNSNIFNLFILDNYAFVTSHESTPGLNLIQPSLNCRIIR
ncbi:unnamed protein product [Rotaria sp. Silwood1]|nr:unnamed protein product [Rotaria sp. Silwood1]